MNDSDQVITITILDRTYKIKCPPGGAKELQESAQYVDEQMKKTQKASNSPRNMDQIAVVTTLNISHEMLLLKKQHAQSLDEMNQRIQALSTKILDRLAIKEKIAL